MRHSDCGTRAVQKQQQVNVQLRIKHYVSPCFVRMFTGIVQCNPAVRYSDCDNRTTTQDVLLHVFIVSVSTTLYMVMDLQPQYRGIEVGGP
jgi:hypothetical protein